MKVRAILILVILINITLTGFSKPVKVMFTYNLEDISLIYNGDVFKECPKKLAIDFELGGSLIAFKSGYESQTIKISKDNIFTSYKVILQPLENIFTNSIVQVELKKASFINYVTNFTQEEVTEIVNSKMNQCNLTTYSENSIFKNVKGNLNKFSIGVEVLKSESKNGSYTSPFYLFSNQKIKWYVLENATNNLLLEVTTDGFYLAYFKSTRGVVASDRLKEVTILSLEEATQKFINSPEFIGLMMSKDQ